MGRGTHPYHGLIIGKEVVALGVDGPLVPDILSADLFRKQDHVTIVGHRRGKYFPAFEIIGHRHPDGNEVRPPPRKAAA
jgi:hypothetical protein